MKRLAALAAMALALGGCDGIECAGTTNNNCQAPHASASDRPFEGATVRHDDRRAVTCWVYSHPSYREGGISCLPDWMLTPGERPPIGFAPETHP